MSDLYCTIKEGWWDAGQRGKVLGPNIKIDGMKWTPVLWEDEEDPTFHKTRGLEFTSDGYGFVDDEHGIFGWTN